jgi:hypothetical protein
LTLAVTTPTPAFTLDISPALRVAKPDQAVSYTVTVIGFDDFSQPVTLELGGLPTGCGGAWSTNPVTPGTSSTLVISVPSSPPYGRHVLQVFGTAGTHIVAAGTEIIITYPFDIYLPTILRSDRDSRGAEGGLLQ